MKFVSMFCLLLSMSLTALAQDEDVLRPRGSNSSNARRGSSSSSSSSTPIIFGIEGGINYNMFSQTLAWAIPVANSNVALYESGSGISPLFGAFVDFGVTQNLGIQVKLAYDQKKFGNSKSAIRDCQIEDPITGIISLTDANVTGEYSQTMTYIDITPQLRWNVTPELFFLVGPTAHFQLDNGSATFTETISSDGQCFYSPNTPQQSKTISASTDSLATNAPRIGMQLDLGYKLALSPSVYLVPKIGYQYMFTKLAEDVPITGNPLTDNLDYTKFYTLGTIPYSTTNAALHSLQFTLGLWFQL